MSNFRPFILYTDSECEAACRAWQAICQNWCADWFVGASIKKIVLHGCALSPLPEPANWQVHNQGDNTLLLDHSPKVLKAIALALAGKAAVLEPPRLPLTPLVEEVVNNALEDLAAMLAGPQAVQPHLQEKVILDAKQIISSTQAAGSGAVWAGFELEGASFSCVIPLALAQRLMPERKNPQTVAELQPLKQAIAQRRLRAKVMLGHGDLTLGDVAALEPGNVILLDGRVLGEAPPDFELQTLDGELISPVQIGKQGPHAVAIISRKH